MHQEVQGGKVIAAAFANDFTYGPAKEMNKELGIVHLDISVQDLQTTPASPHAALDIDLSGVDDYFSVLSQGASLQQTVADQQVRLGQAPSVRNVTVEAVTLDESISLQASSDNPVRLTAFAYRGSSKEATDDAQALDGHSDPQTVEQGNPKTFTVPGLKSGQAYVITLEDSKGKLFAGPIMTDHTGASLKTLPSISRAHVSIRSVTVKLKEVVLGLQIRDTAKLTG